MSKEEAGKVYIAKVETLIKEIGLQGVSASAGGSTTSSSGDDAPLIITVQNSVKTIKFNRPHKLNAFTVDMYRQITDELNNASKDDSIKAVIITGSGESLGHKLLESQN